MLKSFSKRKFCMVTGTLFLLLIIFTTMKEEFALDSSLKTLNIESNAFEHNGFMPEKYTGRGEDISPQLTINGISSNAKSIAIVMDDLDVPFIGTYNHWLIWNIPVQNTIPENIPHGEMVETLGKAVQGIGYGKNGYRGPKPPAFIKKVHRYQFHVYVLDCQIELDSRAKKKDFMKTIDGHVIQYGDNPNNLKILGTPIRK